MRRLRQFSREYNRISAAPNRRIAIFGVTSKEDNRPGVIIRGTSAATSGTRKRIWIRLAQAAAGNGETSREGRMYQSFDPFEYVNYLGHRWRVVVLACVAAVVVSLAVSLLLPKRYTATATVVIDPPAGADARTATAVSPVYLESLKSYERYADSDTLFARAAEHFH